MHFINFNPLWRDFNSYHVSHDGEGDDIQALVIASDALRGEKVTVDCVFGNRDIIHVSENISEEMEARMALTNEVFGASIAIHGAESNDDISEKYVNEILEQSLEKKCLVLHTDSFKSLHALFNRAKPGQLKNVTILTYGSVNLSWAMPKPESYKPFYDSLTASGARLVQIDGFPFLGTKNKLIEKNTPLTHSLLEHLDGQVGKKWSSVNTRATNKVRAKQAIKVGNYICRGIEEASVELRKQLTSLVTQIAELFGSAIDEITPVALQQLLNLNLVGQHDCLESKLNELCALLLTILDENEVNLKAPFNIYAGTCLQGQALIADQIPAIIFSELIENRKNGIAKECFSAQFDGFTGRFAKYSASAVQGSLYYLDTKKKSEGSNQKEAELVDSYLKYIDLCIATALLANDQMITSAKRNYLLSSKFKTDLDQLAEAVQILGYDLPNSYKLSYI